MTESEINVVLGDLENGRITARKAVERLVAGGMHLLAAKNCVFIALGGGDIVNMDADGMKRYRQSGKSVDEVQRLMLQ